MGPKPRPVHYFELTKPHRSDHLAPSCAHSISLLTSATARYSPPSGCSTPWSHVALQVWGTPGLSSRQFLSDPLPNLNDVTALWLDGAELIRMSPPQSTQDGLEVFWEVRKDVTRFTSLLEKSNLSLTLTSLRTRGNESFSVSPASYQVNVSIFYYNYKYLSRSSESSMTSETIMSCEGALKGGGGLYDPPPDLVIPLSNKKNQDEGLWFQIESEFDVRSVGLEMPSNTMRAILELFVSSDGDDEFWPSHRPNSIPRANHFSSKHESGAFKEVFVMIDGKIVGSEVPFPVIFPGSINPLFWEPIVAIGAFDHPTYDIDLTPFLESMIDEIEARLVVYHYYPALRIEQKSEFKGFERRLELRARRKSRFTGWVLSSEGNFTTRVSQETELKNSIRFDLSGRYMEIKHEIESEREVQVETETGQLFSLVTMKRKYPMSVTSYYTMRRPDRSTYYSGSANVTMKEKLVRGKRSRVYHNSQSTCGWVTVKDEMVVGGSARTEQNLKYRDGVSGGGCCIREAAAQNGRLLKDEASYLCGSSSSTSSSAI
ncbi:hypothetical protein CDL15_Pgr016098 [Punica granatum]|uniref:Peptide N-acetyl-beta-D-glucosaminyl asparaginase amidase A N-terminal domain-containing protein n=1 Tax=Punica granatum TaxID=22663 RepID=A0A218X076_PUNGR|nr:hypothetical protein CDL15_Pgr016098 [Punica granatum]